MTAVIDSFEGDYEFLSNFYIHHGWTVEHHYQAAKTDDPLWAARILAAHSPGRAKKLGRQVPLRPGWDDQKIPVMRTLLRIKFGDPELAIKLVGTGDADLIEGNWWNDTFWGVYRGQGENWLGKLLMDLRGVLIEAGV